MSLSSKDRIKYQRHVMVAGEDAVARVLLSATHAMSHDTVAERTRIAYSTAAGLRSAEAESARISGLTMSAGLDIALGANDALREVVTAASPIAAEAFDEDELRALLPLPESAFMKKAPG